MEKAGLGGAHLAASPVGGVEMGRSCGRFCPGRVRMDVAATVLVILLFFSNFFFCFFYYLIFKKLSPLVHIKFIFNRFGIYTQILLLFMKGEFS